MATLVNTVAGSNSNFFANKIDAIRVYFENRKTFKTTVRELSRLTDRELNDLGISRSEIYSVARGVIR